MGTTKHESYSRSPAGAGSYKISNIIYVPVGARPCGRAGGADNHVAYSFSNQ